MSVLDCDRNNCGRAMCDIYISEGDIGYICTECWMEFKNMIEKKYKWDEELTKSEWIKELEDFMKTEKKDEFELDDRKITFSQYLIKSHKRKILANFD